MGIGLQWSVVRSVRRLISASAIFASGVLLLAVSPMTSAHAGFDSLQMGVYGCMDQDGYDAPTLQWGLLDGSTYSDFDGGRGGYTYDAATGVLTFTSGRFKGLRRKRTEDRLFRILDEHGSITAFSCPWTPKNPKKLHW